MTARRKEIGGAGSAIAVELSMDDAELAERVRMMLITWPGIEILDADDGMPQVRITDGAVELAPKVPVLVLTDASGAIEALQAGASAVLSECVDGDTLCIAIEPQRKALPRCRRNFAIISSVPRAFAVLWRATRRMSRRRSSSPRENCKCCGCWRKERRTNPSPGAST